MCAARQVCSSAHGARRRSCRGQKYAMAGRARTSPRWRWPPAAPRCAGRTGAGGNVGGWGVGGRGGARRWPRRARRSRMRCGVGACGFRWRTMRPEKRPHRSVALTCSGSLSAILAATAGNDGCCSAAPVSAETSRAMPWTLRQCARLGVSLRVNSMSSRSRCTRMSWPRGADASSSSKPPPCSSDSLSSRAEHSMPWLGTPRSWPSSMRTGWPSSPAGSSAPTNAQGTLMSTRALGAPQTMLSRAPPCPTSTWHTRRRSASGCCATALLWPTTTRVQGGDTGRRASPSRPAMVSVCASSTVVNGGLQTSRNQDSGNCMVRLLYGSALPELRQKTDVAVKEQAQVVDAVAQHGQSVQPHAEGKADVLFGIQSHVAHHVRMHLARAGHFQPAASQRAGLKPDVDLGAGLREGEKTGAKAQHQIIAFKKPAAKAREDDLQVLETHVLADPQALALVEHRRVRGVAVDAVGAARGDHADLGHGLARIQRRAMRFDMLHRVAYLHRAGVRL